MTQAPWFITINHSSDCAQRANPESLHGHAVDLLSEANCALARLVPNETGTIRKDCGCHAGYARMRPPNTDVGDKRPRMSEKTLPHQTRD